MIGIVDQQKCGLRTDKAWCDGHDRDIFLERRRERLVDGRIEQQVDTEELRRLAMWIDCNAVFYGSYAPEDQARQLRGEKLPMPAIQ